MNFEPCVVGGKIALQNSDLVLQDSWRFGRASFKKNSKKSVTKFVAQELLHTFAAMKTKQLKRLVKNSGYKSKHLAEYLGVSESNFSRYISGKIPIPVEKEEKLLNYLTKKSA